MNAPGRVLPIVCGCGRRLGRTALVAFDARGWWPAMAPPDSGGHAQRWGVEHWLLSLGTRRDVGQYRDGQVPMDYGDWPVRLQCKACRFELRAANWRDLYPLLDGVTSMTRGRALTLPLIGAYQRTHPLA